MKKIIIKLNILEEEKKSSRIEKHLKNKEKIHNCKANLEAKTISIICQDDLTIEEIEEYLEEIGYSSLGVELVSKIHRRKTGITVLLGIVLLGVFLHTLKEIVPIPFFQKMTPKSEVLLLCILSIVFIGYGMTIIIDGISKLFTKKMNLNSLLSIDIIVTYIYSYVLFFKVLTGNSSYMNNVYIEICFFLIYFQKIGHSIERKNQEELELEVSQLSKTNRNKVSKKEGNSYKEIFLEDAKKGDTILCLPGDRILLDGTIISGNTHLDESSTLGKSVSSPRKEQDKVLSGSMNCENEIEYRVDRILRDTYTSQISKEVIDERRNKERGIKKIDYLCLIWTPIFVVITFIILGLIYFITKKASVAFTTYVLIWNIVCPLSLTLITPLAFQKSSKYAKKKGVLIKRVESLLQLRTINTVVFDKTGTLTNGYLSVSRINNHSEMEDKELLELLGAIEKHSSHAIARGINKYLRSERIKVKNDFITEDLDGYGVKAKDDNTIYYACNGELLKKLDIINSYKEEERKLTLEGNTTIYLVKNKKVIATFGLKDNVKKEAKKVMDYLKEKNIEIMILSGDSDEITKKIAKELGIKKAYGNQTTESKKENIKKLLQTGRKVMVIGDGINDAPSLATATISLVFKGSNDIAISAADGMLMNSSLLKIIELFTIRKIVLRTEKQNRIITMVTIFMLFIMCLIFREKLKTWMILVGMLISTLFVIGNTFRRKRK